MSWNGKIESVPKTFFLQDAIKLAPALLGCRIHTLIDGEHCSGIITETEAYHESEKACHAYNGKRTPRTEVMFAQGGVSYVYLCYGIHHLFNVVCGEEGIAQAVLIRAINADDGLGCMKKRRKRTQINSDFTNGPGKLSEALGIKLDHSGSNLQRAPIWIERAKHSIDESKLLLSKRIGVEYAKEDAALLWRFQLIDFDDLSIC